MIIDSKKLWEEGGYGKDNPLERSISHVKKVGKEAGVPEKAVAIIISQTFIGLQNGEKYSLDKCRCGCGTDKSGTDITHCMVARVLEIGKRIQVEKDKIMETELNSIITKHFTDNDMRPINPLMNWKRSGVVRLWKWMFKSGS